MLPARARRAARTWALIGRTVQPAAVLATTLSALLALAGCSATGSGGSRSNGPRRQATSTPGIALARDTTPPPADTTRRDSSNAAAYEGVDPRGIPRYAAVELSSRDADLLRRAYGIEDPHRLYVSDSTDEGILKYDTQRKRCLTCYVNSYRIGYVSVRRSGESWDEVERRVRTTTPMYFTGGENPSSTSTAELDPDVRPLAERMLRDARAAGYRLHVTATYRSPLREAFLMAEGRGRTHTLTSSHSYGRALDIVIDDGNRHNAHTRHNWIAFRQWVTHYRASNGESFRVLGSLDHTWDWPHVELPSSTIGFGSIDKAIARARMCLAPGSAVSCNFPPHLPANLGQPLVQ
ncbi:MAG: hypothetical protein ABJA80_05245 [bacterium]